MMFSIKWILVFLNALLYYHCYIISILQNEKSRLRCLAVHIVMKFYTNTISSIDNNNNNNNSNDNNNSNSNSNNNNVDNPFVIARCYRKKADQFF